MIKAKFVAILLGPEGAGIMGLLSSTNGIIGTFTSFGLETSSVKNVAAANASGNKSKVSLVVSVLNKLVWGTGLLGMLLVVLFASSLSEIAFGNKDYTIAFIWISVTLLFTQLSSGQLVVLRGLRKIHYMAKASVLGAIAGLLISVPLYYFFGLNGIVPSIIMVSMANLAFSWHFRRKVKLYPSKITRAEAIHEGKDMLKLGFALSLTGIFQSLRLWGLKIFISNIGGIAQVGLYNAGLTIINTYTGMVFTAMGKDYFPRLAEVSHDEKKACVLVNQQAEISLLILSPLLLILISFSNYVISLLLSQEFIAVSQMVQFAALGVYFRAVSWAIAVMFVAKGDTKLFFLNEFVAGLVSFLSYLLCYYLWKLDGVGVAYLFVYVYYTCQVYIITKAKYNFVFTKELIRLFIVHFTFGVGCIFLLNVIKNPLALLSIIFLIIIACYNSFKQLDKRIGLKDVINKVLNKK